MTFSVHSPSAGGARFIGRTDPLSRGADYISSASYARRGQLVTTDGELRRPASSRFTDGDATTAPIPRVPKSPFRLALSRCFGRVSGGGGEVGDGDGAGDGGGVVCGGGAGGGGGVSAAESAAAAKSATVTERGSNVQIAEAAASRRAAASAAESTAAAKSATVTERGSNVQASEAAASRRGGGELQRQRRAAEAATSRRGGGEPQSRRRAAEPAVSRRGGGEPWRRRRERRAGGKPRTASGLESGSGSLRPRVRIPPKAPFWSVEVSGSNPPKSGEHRAGGENAEPTARTQSRHVRHSGSHRGLQPQYKQGWHMPNFAKLTGRGADASLR